MTERWKYQIKTGGFWGVLMIVMTTLFQLKEKPFMEQISSPKYYLRFAIYVAAGIFILGYFNWKAKVKNDSKQ